MAECRSHSHGDDVINEGMLHAPRLDGGCGWSTFLLDNSHGFLVDDTCCAHGFMTGAYDVSKP